MSEPITREEMYLAALGGEALPLPDPLTREELYLAYLNGMTDTYPDPITRTEQYLYKLCQNGMGGGGGVTIRNQNKTITENGEYTHDAGYTGLGVVTVNVKADGGGGDLLNSIIARSITELEVDTATEIGERAFYQWTNLTRAYFPAVKTIKNGAFEKCSKLESVDFPEVTTIENLSLGACSALTSVNMPKLEYAGGYAMYGANSLIEVEFPAYNGKVENSFLATSNTLKRVIFGTSGTQKTCNLQNGCFSKSTLLDTLVLRYDTLCPLSSTGAFTGTPFASGGTGGTVYVPSALISAYQTATNWSTLYAAGTCNFVAIEGSEYE